MTNLLPPKDAAEKLGMTEQTLAHWRVQGSGPAYVKFGEGKGARVRYAEADLNAFIAKNVRQSTTEAA